MLLLKIITLRKNYDFFISDDSAVLRDTAILPIHKAVRIIVANAVFFIFHENFTQYSSNIKL